MTGAEFLIYFLVHGADAVQQIYMSKVLAINGIGSLLVCIPILRFFRKDHIDRVECGLQPEYMSGRLHLWNVIWLLILGAALSQIVNVAVSILFTFFDGGFWFDEIMEMISEGKSVGILILWTGIVAPVCEEILFRWVVYLRLRDYMGVGIAAFISGLLFGIYHGNILQFVYASILGIYFALILEWTGNLWASVLLHIGANIWSTVVSEYGETVLMKMSEWQILAMFLGFFLVILVMTMRMNAKYHKRHM